MAKRYTTPLPGHEQERLRALVTSHPRGLVGVSEALALSPATIAKALAGLPVARATVVYVRTQLGVTL